MGHSSLAVLQRYLALAGLDIERAHRLHSPVDNLLKYCHLPREQKRAISSRDSPSSGRVGFSGLVSRLPAQRGITCQADQATAQEEYSAWFRDELDLAHICEEEGEGRFEGGR